MEMSRISLCSRRSRGDRRISDGQRQAPNDLESSHTGKCIMDLISIVLILRVVCGLDVASSSHRNLNTTIPIELVTLRTIDI